MSEEIVEGGMTVTKKCIRWKLNNFAQMFIHDVLVKQQKMMFDVIDSKGVTSKWKLSLDFKEDDQKETSEESSTNPQLYLSLMVCLISKSDGRSHLDAKLVPDLEGKNGTNIFRGGCGFNPRYNVGETKWWLIHKMKINTEIGHLLPPDGVMSIKMNLLIFDGLIETSTEKMNLEKEMVSERQRALYQIVSGLENDKNDCNVRIISRDGQEFSAHRWLLSGTSDVFAAMFRVQMNEKTTGEVKFDDLSRKAVKILLHYVYTGKMAPDWGNFGTVEEVVYAADKYQIMEMKNYLDKKLGSVCTMENASVLLSLANKTGLRTAESDLLRFIKEKIKDTESFFGIVNNSGNDNSDDCTESNVQS